MPQMRSIDRRPRASGLGQLLQAGADQRLDRGALALRRGGAADRRQRFAAAIAEVDQGRDGAARSRRRRQPPGRTCAGRAAPASSPARRSFSSLRMRPASRGPTPFARVSAALSWLTTARASSSGVSTESTPSATRAPTPCTCCSTRNQLRSPAIRKAVQHDALGPDLGLDVQIERLAGPGQGREGAHRAVHQIADAADVDHQMVGALRIQEAAQPRDHPPPAAAAQAAARRRRVAS